MLLFRSEEHLERWLTDRGQPRGGIMSVEQQWRLAQTWYANRLASDWRGRTPEQALSVFEEIGLTGPFWHPVPKREE